MKKKTSTHVGVEPPNPHGAGFHGFSGIIRVGLIDYAIGFLVKPCFFRNNHRGSVFEQCFFLAVFGWLGWI